MAKTAKINLGGQEYTVHAFNIGELEQVASIISNEVIQASSRSFAILKLALLRAEPKVSDVDAIEPESLNEVIEASKTVMGLAGLADKATANPPEEVPAASPT